MLKINSRITMEDSNMWTYLKGAWPVLSLGVFCGFVSLISGEKKITVRIFFGGLLLSAFVALMVDALVTRADIGPNATVVSIGMASFCSREIIEIAKRVYLSRFKKALGDTNVKKL